MRRAALTVCVLFATTVCLGAPGAAPAAARTGTITKLLIIAEENHSYREVIGSRRAPYINRLAQRYGLATDYHAGTPTSAQSIPSYFLMTAGSTFGAVRDCAPAKCPQSGDNIFAQAGAVGGWRTYAESMPGTCHRRSAGGYVPWHAPAPYYTDVSGECAHWDIGLSALADDLAGTLPGRYSFVSPNLFHDMHSGSIKEGDRWLAAWLPKILAGPDYRAGRLAVVITWDEGSSNDNHVPTIVISPRTVNLRVATPFTHASLLRTSEEILGVPLLRKADSAPSMISAFHLG
jgi:hypothetical protein